MLVDFMKRLARRRYVAFKATATVHARKLPDYDIVVVGGEYTPEYEVMAQVMEQVLVELRSGTPIQSLTIKVEQRDDL